MKTQRDYWTLGFLALVLISVLLKIPALHQPLSEDETMWAKVIYHGTWEARFQSIPHPPLAMLFYITAANIGLPLKIVPLLFATAGIIVLFFALRKRYDSRSAALASGIILLTPLFTIGSLQLDIDGGFILFFLALLFFNEYAKNRLPGLAIISGLMLLTKYTAVLFFIPFWIRELWVNRKRIKAVAKVVAYGLLGIAIALLFPILSFLLKADYFSLTIHHGGAKLLNFSSWQPSVLFLMAQVLLLAGPILIYALFGSRRNWLALSVIGVALLFYLVIVTDPGRPLERYLVPLLIPAGILIAPVMRKIRLSWAIAVSAAIASAAFFVINLSTTTIIPFNHKFAYLTTLFYLVPFRGSSGPFGFYVSSLVLIIGWFAFLAVLVWRKKRFFPVLIGVLLATTLVMNAEFLYALTTPSTAVASSLLYTPQGRVLTHRNFGIEKYPDATTLWDGDLSNTSFNSTNPTTVILLNFPPYDPPLRQTLSANCILEKNATSRGVLIAQRFFCP